MINRESIVYLNPILSINFKLKSFNNIFFIVDVQQNYESTEELMYIYFQFFYEMSECLLPNYWPKKNVNTNFFLCKNFYCNYLPIEEKSPLSANEWRVWTTKATMHILKMFKPTTFQWSGGSPPSWPKIYIFKYLFLKIVIKKPANF